MDRIPTQVEELHEPKQQNCTLVIAARLPVWAQISSWMGTQSLAKLKSPAHTILFRGTLVLNTEQEELRMDTATPLQSSTWMKIF